MAKYWIILLLFVCVSTTWAQQVSVGLGVFTGLTSSFTLDDGITADPRYTTRYEVNFAPVGIYLGIDYEGFGIGVSPGLVNLGQTFYVVNTVGGQDGRRTLDLQYLQIPVAFKVHVISLSFFRVSALASVAPAFLLRGREVVGHTASKLIFPTEVYPILPPDYVVQYDGVVVPDVDEYVISDKEDFKPFQVFVAAGFRSDWDVSDHWRVSLDFRLNYGIYESRTDAYLQSLNNYQELYAVPGTRPDLFPQLTIGISRFISLERRDIDQRKRLKGSSRQHKVPKYPYPKPRTKKPKG
jgi:hypothetical protein